ncbi:MAG: alkaline phosphatase D family protein [Cytophagaceae bacterium]
MPGYSTMNEALIWVQTSSEAQVQIKYRKKNEPDSFMSSSPVLSIEKDGYAVKVKISGLEPSSVYEYELFLNDQKVAISHPLEFQTNSLTVTDFSVVFGSCAVFTKDESITHIYESIASKNPDLMVWMGDNIYLDASDWDSTKNIIREYTNNRSLRQMQPLLAATHHYAIWDDHDYGPDNSDSSFYNKEISREAFQIFWANPSFGLDGQGINTSFRWHDADFFMLDDRYHRAPDKEKNKAKPYLGDKQLTWLITSLKESKARFKIIVIGNQVINQMPFERENYSNYKKERKSLMKQLKDNRIEGVFFVTGDRHFSEISRKRRRRAYPLYDITVSPLTSGPITTRLNFNTKRIRGSLIRKRNFALLEFCGTGSDRAIKISYFDTKGELLYQNLILADCLTYR